MSDVIGYDVFVAIREQREAEKASAGAMKRERIKAYERNMDAYGKFMAAHPGNLVAYYIS